MLPLIIFDVIVNVRDTLSMLFKSEAHECLQVYLTTLFLIPLRSKQRSKF